MNRRVRLAELSQALGRRTTLDDIPDADLDELRRLCFDWLWLLGVWQTGPASRGVSLTVPELRREYAHVLPDLTDDDIVGSCFAIRRYAVHADFGGDEALARLRERARARGLRLMLDFVPNHTALDHDWVTTHPEFYVSGTEIDLAPAPANYTRVETGRKEGKSHETVYNTNDCIPFFSHPHFHRCSHLANGSCPFKFPI